MKIRSYTNLLAIVALILFAGLKLNGQNLDLEKNIFFSGFHYSVSGSSGLTKFDFDPTTNLFLESPLLTQNSVSLEAKYYLKQRFFLSSSIGYLYTTQKNAVKISGMDWYNYTDGLAWLGYKKFDIGIGNSRMLNSKFLLGTSLKLGGLHGEKRSPLFREQDGSSIQANSQINYFALAKVSLSKILKNHNLLDLGLYYRQSFSDIYEGTYSGPSESADYSGKGSEVGLSIGYSFTGYERRLSETKSKREILEYKKKFRNIEQRARLFELSVDLFSFLSANNDPEDIIVNSYSNKFGIRAETEFSIQDVKFWEMGLHVGAYCTGFVVLNENRIGRFAQSQAGVDYQFALNWGYGYRFRTKKEISIITLSGGIAINGSLSGSSGSSSRFSNVTNEYIYKLEFEDDIKTIIYPTIYANLNRDFQISKSMYLSLNFRYNLGFISNIVRSFEAETYGSSVRNFEGKRNGTSRALGIGLKYNFGEKKKQ